MYNFIDDEEMIGNVISGDRYLEEARVACSANAASGSNGPFVCSDLLLLRKLLNRALGYDHDEAIAVRLC